MDGWVGGWLKGGGSDNRRLIACWSGLARDWVHYSMYCTPYHSVQQMVVAGLDGAGGVVGWAGLAGLARLAAVDRRGCEPARPCIGPATYNSAREARRQKMRAGGFRGGYIEGMRWDGCSAF